MADPNPALIDDAKSRVLDKLGRAWAELPGILNALHNVNTKCSWDFVAEQIELAKDLLEDAVAIAYDNVPVDVDDDDDEFIDTPLVDPPIDPALYTKPGGGAPIL